MRTQIRRASPVARNALQIMAGWQHSHRSIEAEAAELLDIQERDAAARQTFVKVVRNVTVAALLVIGVATTAPAHADQAVSPRMAELIEMYKAVSGNIDALDPHTNAAAWIAAEEAWMRAEADLMNERPLSVCDYSAKFDTLLEIDSSEGEFARLKRLSEDALALGGCAK